LHKCAAIIGPKWVTQRSTVSLETAIRWAGELLDVLEEGSASMKMSASVRAPRRTPG
jgi:hypothetical protein